MVDVSVIGDDPMDLPPGFRFHPTDEEIISSYLTQKVLNVDFCARAIGEVDLNKCEPWDLPKKAKMGEKEWYFFCQRDRKYPTGMRTNRATESGYWKATGKDKEIYKGKNCLVGMKKTLVFYRGRAPKGEKTNWVMHEYRLDGKFSYHNLPRSAKDEWVVSRVFHKNSGVKKIPISPGLLRLNSFGDDFFDTTSLPSLLDDPPFNEKFDGTTTTTPQSTTSMMRTSETNQLSYSTSLDTNNHQQHQDNKNFLPNNFSFSTYQTNPYNNPNYYPQIQNTLYTFQPPSSSAYLHQDINFNSPDQAFLRALAANNNDADAYGLKRECKVEQFSSNQSRVSLSQDTGLSTDVNTTEISSVVSRNDMGGNTYEDLEGPSSSGAVQDLDPLWNY